MTTLQEVTLALAALKKDREEEKCRHENKIEEMNALENNLCWKKAALERGVDMAQIERGMRIVRVYADSRIDLSNQSRQLAIFGVINDARLDAANGFPLLRGKSFGLKDYDRWENQRSDHEYGMGPRHGDIIFRISLTGEGLHKSNFLPEDINAVIYYLTKYLDLEIMRRLEEAMKANKKV